MLPHVLLASESAGAAMMESIARIFQGGLLLVGVLLFITGLVLLSKKNQITGWIPCLIGIAMAGYAGFALVF